MTAFPSGAGNLSSINGGHTLKVGANRYSAHAAESDGQATIHRWSIFSVWE